MSAGQTAASPAAIRVRSSPTPTQPPPSTTMNRSCSGWRAARSARCARRRARRPSPRPSEWMTWPVSPTDPIGPSGRRWPTPNRRISIGTRSSAALSAGGAAAAGGGRRARFLIVASGFGELLLLEVALARELRLVRREERREPDEADPDQRRQADDLGGEDDEVVEHEERLDDDQAERDQAGPPQPLPHLEVRRVAMERPRPDVVEDRQDDQEDERRDPGRVEDVREVVAVERGEQVLPGSERHRWASWSRVDGPPEYAMSGGILGRKRCGAVASVPGTPRPAPLTRARATGSEEAPGASPAVSGEPRRDRRAGA